MIVEILNVQTSAALLPSVNWHQKPSVRKAIVVTSLLVNPKKWLLSVDDQWIPVIFQSSVMAKIQNVQQVLLKSTGSVNQHVFRFLCPERSSVSGCARGEQSRKNPG